MRSSRAALAVFVAAAAWRSGLSLGQSPQAAADPR